MDRLKIMIVDDEPGYRNEIGEFLSESGFEVSGWETPKQALRYLEDHEVDLAILDLRLPQMSGLELMKKLHQRSPETGVIMISGHADIDSVIEALREGAIDFFPKPFRLTDIRFAIERSQKFLSLQDTLSETRKTCDSVIETLSKQNRAPMIGASPQIQQVLQMMDQVSSNPFTDVLIIGESGTGKELVARGIHDLGNGRNKAFFDVNCTAVPESLFESEFFGHTRNAFTGACDEKKGYFELASGGTLFLDEIGDLPLNMQAKLLRVLEERKIRRVGSSTDIPVRLRVIASTNQNLPSLISQNRFRRDLFYRLNRFAIQVPPLRERPQDIPLLLDHYNRHLSRLLMKPLKPISSRMNDLLCAYSFPGNVRELKNMIERAIILSAQKDTELLHFQFPSHSAELEPFMPENNLDLAGLEELEIGMIRRAMELCGQNKTQAAKLLNINRASLNRRLDKFKI